MNKERLITLSLIILAAAASRLLPHPENVTPIAAIALFSGAQFGRSWLAFIVPAVAMLLSDAILGFHPTLPYVYAAFALTVCMGVVLKNNIKAKNVAVFTLASSVVFFIITNFGTWLSGGIYPATFDGLVACFIAAIPFFTHSLLGDLFYSAILFIGFVTAEQKFSVLCAVPAKARPRAN